MPVQTEHRFLDRVTVVSSAGAQAHLAAGCTGPCSFNTVASCSSTRPASCDAGWRPALPTGSFDGPTLQAAIDRL